MFDFISKALKVDGKMTSKGADRVGMVVAASMLIAVIFAGSIGKVDPEIETAV